MFRLSTKRLVELWNVIVIGRPGSLLSFRLCVYPVLIMSTCSLPRIVAKFNVKYLTCLPIAVDPSSHASDADICTSKEPGSRLVLQSHIDTMREPVRYIGGERDLPMKFDIAILQICSVHDLVHMKCVIREDDCPVVTAQLESLLYGRRIVHGLAKVRQGLWVQVARCAVVDYVT